MLQRMIIKSMSGNERQLDELSPNGLLPACARPVTGNDVDDRAAVFPDREYNQKTISENYGPTDAIDSDKPKLPIILKVAGGQAVLHLSASWRTTDGEPS